VDSVTQAARLEREAAEARAQAAAEEQAVRRLDRSRALAQRDADFLRAQLDALDMEATTLGTAELDRAKAERIAHLEQLVAEYRATITTLEAEAAAAAAMAAAPAAESTKMAIDTPVTAAVASAAPAAEQQLEAVKRERDLLTKQVQSLEQQVVLLERQINRGDYNPATTKVLHLRRNPAQAAEDERRALLQQLQQENDRLMRELEADRARRTGEVAAVAATVPEAAVTPVAGTPGVAERMQLEKRLMDSEKKIQRLKEVFGEKIREFREVCYSLTGYEIEMMADNTYVLRSMFAEREVDTLAFARDRTTGNVAMLDTEFSRSIRRMIEPLLRMRNSIPAITATVTLDLFSKQTNA